MSNKNNKIGNVIKYYREAKHISQSKLAEQIGVTQRNVSYYENGERIPPADILSKIAAIFDITLDELVGTKKTSSRTNDCYDYFYEEGDFNWNIKQIAKAKNIDYQEILEKSCIPENRFDLLWFGHTQPVAEELVRISHVLDVSVDYLLDNSQRERITPDEEVILQYYHCDSENIMILLSSYCSLDSKTKLRLLGKCLDLEHEESVAADEPQKRTGTENTGK